MSKEIAYCLDCGGEAIFDDIEGCYLCVQCGSGFIEFKVVANEEES